MTRDATRYSKDLVERGIGLSMHLGWFADAPAATLDEGQARLDELVLRAAGLVADGDAGPSGRPASSVLDVACGLGGTLARVASVSDAALVGVDLGEGQLARARDAVWSREANVRFVKGDACALPFADDSFDRVLCVEAAFHFPSRAKFLGEAARVLQPEGLLVMTDIIGRQCLPRALALPAADERGDTVLSAGEALHQHLGPWLDPFGAEGNVDDLAASAGLRVVRAVDLSAGTQPSYERFLGSGRMPRWPPAPGADAMAKGVSALGWLQGCGELHVVLLALSHDQR